MRAKKLQGFRNGSHRARGSSNFLPTKEPRVPIENTQSILLKRKKKKKLKTPFQIKICSLEHITRFTSCSRVQPFAIPGRHLEPSPRKGLAVASTPNPHRTAQIATSILISNLQEIA